MRPIDADALQKVVMDLAPHPHDQWETIGVFYIIEQMHTLTLDDLRPKGRWEPADDGDGVVCSECGTDFCILVYATDDFHFCPSCGADMRGGGEEGDREDL